MPNQKKCIVAHAGKQHSYHTAKALLRANALQRYYTSGYVKSQTLQKYFTNKKSQYWIRRFEHGLAQPYVRNNWLLELPEIVARKFTGKSTLTQNLVYKRDVNFDKAMVRQLKKENYDLFWGFQGSCRLALEAANKMGKISVCELATAHINGAQKYLGEEQKLHPEWADSIDHLVFPAWFEKRLVEEPQVAQKVISASAFTRQTLEEAGIEKSKIYDLPLGFDISKIAYQPKTRNTNQPLKVLYAGTVTQRKGIKYLLEACNNLGEAVELHIIGGVQGSGKAFEPYRKQIHYHAPIAQAELFARYAQFDVLALPSVFEGFGLVIVEAMAAGLPVVVTPHTFGAEIVSNQQNGIVVPIRSSKAIADALQFFASLDSDAYAKASVAARSAAQQYSWDAFGQRLTALLPQLLA